MVQVKLFDCDHEQDLEEEMNEFLEQISPRDVVDIKYNVALLGDASGEQVFCFSALIIYNT